MDEQAETRQRIIDTARELISARSYHAVGVAEICRQAGAQKGSFYHFFPSKRALALAALDRTSAFFREAIIDSSFAPDIPPLERIERFFDAIYAFQQQAQIATGKVQGCPFGDLASELGSQDDKLRKKVEGIFRMAEQPIEQALEEVRRDREYRAELGSGEARIRIRNFSGDIELYDLKRGRAKKG